MPYPELEELYNTYRTDLYRYLCHLTHDPAEAEDLLSETFLRALRRLHTYRGDCAVKTWLFGIAHNVWLESLRKRRPTVSADDLLETYLTDDTLPDHTDTRLQWQRVQALLQQKDDRARRVVQLRAQGYSYAEIAVRLGISESSARVIEHRTRTWLKQQLATEGYDL